jgi:CBS domain-containing protein
MTAGTRAGDVCHRSPARREVYDRVMKIKEFMTPAPATCDPMTPLRQAGQMMADRDCAAIPVARSGKLLGIITDRDIACRAVPAAGDAAERPVADFMTAPVITISAEDLFEDAVALMVDNHVHHLPVTDQTGAVVGMVAESDLGRIMSNREYGALARGVTIRRTARHGRIDAPVPMKVR